MYCFYGRSPGAFGPGQIDTLSQSQSSASAQACPGCLFLTQMFECTSLCWKLPMCGDRQQPLCIQPAPFSACLLKPQVT